MRCVARGTVVAFSRRGQDYRHLILVLFAVPVIAIQLLLEAEMSTQLHFLIAVSLWRRLRHLGGLGLVLLGLADSSVVPLPGSMDALTIYLAARHRDLWWYYAFMATVGAVIGGYITYSLARKGGR